jgi:enoyl-CoA hydratase/carnithine racemase
MQLETLLYEESDGVAVVTLNRPDVHNAFNDKMQDELGQVWRSLRTNNDVRAIVLTGAGDRAFCTGMDRSDMPSSEAEFDFDPFIYEDPGRSIGPRSQGLWKPVIAAVNGMACGGAFYLLGQVDFIIAAENATFFDPHVTYGMPAVFEPTLMAARMPFGEVMRMTLMGSHERISASRAETIGLVTQVVPAGELGRAARQIAEVIASQPAAAVQASLRTVWASRDIPTSQVTDLGNMFLNLSWSAAALKNAEVAFSNRKPEPPTIR